MTHLGHDSSNRLTQEVTPQGTVSYTYDAAGLRTSMTAARQAAVSYSYDIADRLTQIVQGSATVVFSYDAAGQRTSTTLPNGFAMAYRYDDAGQLTGIDYKQGNTLVGDLSYQYDAAERRTAVGGSFARTALPAALASAVYDAANRLTQWGGTTLAYDLNGNLTGDGVNTYTWNARNQLAGMTGASFQYDALGRRTAKTVSGAATTYLHDGLNPVQQFGAQAATLLTGLGIDEMFGRTDAAGTRYFLTDALGSTMALSDAAGQAQTQYTFQPFGTATVAGQANANPSHYTGRENDGTGLYYYRARYYSPGLQRFVSEDPIGSIGSARPSRFRDGVNLYEYSLSAPTRFTDPFGLDVTISFWPGAASGRGHVGAGVNTADTIGFYPVLQRDCFPLGCGVEGRLLKDYQVRPGGQPPQVLTIRTRADQDRVMQQVIEPDIRNIRQERTT